MSGADWQQQQQQDELSLYLWSSLNALRGYISVEVFQKAERELGFSEANNGKDSTSIHQGKKSIRASSEVRQQSAF